MKKTVKKTLSALLALTCVLSSVSVFAAKGEFSDLSDPKYEWAAGYIKDMAEKGFISGYDDGTYKPDKSVTRLEVLSLFARAMGSQSEANAKTLEKAKEKYLSKLDKYELNFGGADISYLLYRGVLKEKELDTYLKGNLKNEAMPRYEAAIIITKAMCQEEKATAEVMVDLDYTDAKNIPTKASQYVYYVTKSKIMSGMGDGTFSPETGVLRSQVAVMLSKTVDLMGLTVEELKIASIDSSNVGFYGENSKVEYMGYNDHTKFYVEGKLTDAKDVPVDVNATFTYVNNEIVFVDIEQSIPDAEIEGVYLGFESVDGFPLISVKIDGEIERYSFTEDTKVEYKGKETANIKDFTETDFAKIRLSKGKISYIYGEPKTKLIEDAVIKENDIIKDGTITISHEEDEFDGLKLEIASDVKVKKNSKTSTLDKIYQGDTVSLTIDYGVITKIEATSKTTTQKGTIKVIEISSYPKITLRINGEDMVFAVTSDIEIIVDGKEATFYDFRVGDEVSVTIESEAVKKMEALAPATTAYSRTGTVVTTNDSIGFIKISYIEDGVTHEETVYVKSSTSYITSKGSKKTYKDIEKGQTVTVRGITSNGTYEAELVMIEVE